MNIGIVIVFTVTAYIIIFGFLIPFVSIVRKKGTAYEKLKAKPKTLRFASITYPILILGLSFSWVMNVLLFI
jgi:hypothetical protein